MSVPLHPGPVDFSDFSPFCPNPKRIKLGAESSPVPNDQSETPTKRLTFPARPLPRRTSVLLGRPNSFRPTIPFSRLSSVQPPLRFRPSPVSNSSDAPTLENFSSSPAGRRTAPASRESSSSGLTTPRSHARSEFVVPRGSCLAIRGSPIASRSPYRSRVTPSSDTRSQRSSRPTLPSVPFEPSGGQMLSSPGTPAARPYVDTPPSTPARYFPGGFCPSLMDGVFMEDTTEETASTQVKDCPRTDDDPKDSALMRDSSDEDGEALVQARLAKRKAKLGAVVVDDYSSSGFDFSDNRQQFRELSQRRTFLASSHIYCHQRNLVRSLMISNYKIQDTEVADIQFKFGGLGQGIMKLTASIYDKSKFDFYKTQVSLTKSTPCERCHEFWCLFISRRPAPAVIRSPRRVKTEVPPETDEFAESMIPPLLEGSRVSRANLVQSDETRRLQVESSATSVGVKYDDAYDATSSHLLWFSQSSDIRSEACMKIADEFSARTSEVFLIVKSQDTQGKWMLLGTPESVRLNKPAALTIARDEIVLRAARKGQKGGRLHKIGNSGRRPLCAESANGKDFSGYQLITETYDGFADYEIAGLRDADGTICLGKKFIREDGRASRFCPMDCCIYCGWQTASLYIKIREEHRASAEVAFLGKVTLSTSAESADLNSPILKFRKQEGMPSCKTPATTTKNAAPVSRKRRASSQDATVTRRRKITRRLSIPPAFRPPLAESPTHPIVDDEKPSTTSLLLDKNETLTRVKKELFGV